MSICTESFQRELEMVARHNENDQSSNEDVAGVNLEEEVVELTVEEVKRVCLLVDDLCVVNM